jgi:hypothetical protein
MYLRKPFCKIAVTLIGFEVFTSAVMKSNIFLYITQSSP